MAEQPSLILVVDDNEMNRDMLSRRLKRLGHSTAVAEDGEKALEAIDENDFDLVLLDIMMPNLNGYDTLERIKSNPSTHHVPVIMISAVDDLESIVRCIELGAEDYLFKPFNPVLLKARVGASLEKKRLRTSDSADAAGVSNEAKSMAKLIQQYTTELQNDLADASETQQTKLEKILKTAENLVSLLS